VGWNARAEYITAHSYTAREGAEGGTAEGGRGRGGRGEGAREYPLFILYILKVLPAITAAPSKFTAVFTRYRGLIVPAEGRENEFYGPPSTVPAARLQSGAARGKGEGGREGSRGT